MATMAEHLIKHHTTCASHFMKCAKLHQTGAKAMADGLEKSAAEAQLDFHKSMEGHCCDMAEWHVACARECADMSAVGSMSSDGSGDGDAKIHNGFSATARIDALNKIVPDGVRGIFETAAKPTEADLLKGLKLIGRPGGPQAVTTGDAFTKEVFGG